jgi:hypothetical protein
MYGNPPHPVGVDDAGEGVVVVVIVLVIVTVVVPGFETVTNEVVDGYVVLVGVVESLEVTDPAPTKPVNKPARATYTYARMLKRD